MDTNFEHYKVFYYVAKYENLTKAASVLKTSQPAVTRTIHNLENILGCRLFIRSKTGMKLTPEGNIFYEYVAAGCAQFFKGENNLSNLISLENGTIYISATETALHCYLFEAVRDFNILYPNVHFKILNNSTTDSVNALKEGKVDLAVVSATLQVAAPLKMKIVKKYRDILIGGSRFEKLKDRELSLGELSNCPWVSLTAEAITRKFLDSYFEQHGLQFSPDVELATTDMILPAVRYNLGIGFIPREFAQDDLGSGKVFEIQVKEALPERNILVIHDTEYPQSIASKAFQKFLTEREAEKTK
ncbi:MULTISPECIES: LysR family transcriptional regulator [Blautia]|uniref:LysR family transcriptional regulator n=1 Tax=Blautia TaxID=572511 RepID=UPI001C108968|nr:LysR family transcriptional regulator [Blautia sp. MSJ-36]MBU5446038.1 LysR family transcriptional regulator [Blautia sp. MSJ-36]